MKQVDKTKGFQEAPYIPALYTMLCKISAGAACGKEIHLLSFLRACLAWMLLKGKSHDCGLTARLAHDTCPPYAAFSVLHFSAHWTASCLLNQKEALISSFVLWPSLWLSLDCKLLSDIFTDLQVTIPITKVDGGPVGLSFIGPSGSDEQLLELAANLMQLLELT